LYEADRIAFDTEFVPERTFKPVLCLIQVASDNVLAAIDALAIEDLSEFWELLSEPDIEVVAHAARAELEFCILSSGELPPKVFDTQLAAGMAGLGYPLSYTKLVKNLVGVELPSGQTRTDWERRPLTDAQIDYAIEDVRHLLHLHDLIGAKLSDQGRQAWYEEEIERLKGAVQDGLDDSQQWRRTSGSGNLARADLAVLRELATWRTSRARRQNRPLRQVMRDDQLIELAKRKPRGPEDLEGVRGLGQLAQAKWAKDVFEAIERGVNVPSDQMPARARKSGGARAPDSVQKLLAACLKQVAADHHIATSLLGTSDDVRDVITWHLQGRTEDTRPRLARGWRGRLVGETLEAVLAGTLLVGVIDAGHHGLELLFVEDGEPR
jgi:ribonuclease D